MQQPSFAPLAYAFDAGAAPGRVVGGALLPGFRSLRPALGGTVRIGVATLRLPLTVE
ncbi:MAG TPA: hypothetical protein VET87_09830 [Rubrivivax sp.]|jgi:hypothetical protein|nr:hypothetical protein [Rubrivivax sp.]